MWPQGNCVSGCCAIGSGNSVRRPSARREMTLVPQPSPACRCWIVVPICQCRVMSSVSILRAACARASRSCVLICSSSSPYPVGSI